MYYEARKVALSNGHDFHLAAILKRNKSIIKIGTNSYKTDPKFKRTHDNGVIDYQLHAEMDVLRLYKPGDEITVLRFLADGSLTMAKPCKHCQQFLIDAGVKRVLFSNWNGEIQELKL